MYSREKNIETIAAEEKKKTLWIYNVSGVKSKIFTIPDYPRKYLLKDSEKGSIISIEPSRTFRITSVVMSLLIGIVLYQEYQDSDRSLFILILSILLFSLAVYFGLKYAFSENLNYSIHIAKEGISIKNDFFEWDKINDLLIVSRPIPQSRRDFLIVISTDGSMNSFEISNLNCKKICAAITYLSPTNSKFRQS